MIIENRPKTWCFESSTILDFFFFLIFISFLCHFLFHCFIYSWRPLSYFYHIFPRYFSNNLRLSHHSFLFLTFLPLLSTFSACFLPGTFPSSPTPCSSLYSSILNSQFIRLIILLEYPSITSSLLPFAY